MASPVEKGEANDQYWGRLINQLRVGTPDRKEEMPSDRKYSQPLGKRVNFQIGSLGENILCLVQLRWRDGKVPQYTFRAILQYVAGFGHCNLSQFWGPVTRILPPWKLWNDTN